MIFNGGQPPFNFDLDEKPNIIFHVCYYVCEVKSTKIGIRIQRVITSPEALIADDVWPQDEYNAEL